MGPALGIAIIIIGIIIVVSVFINTFIKKRAREKNPCKDCEFHECRMTHATCDRLAKSQNMK